VTLRQKQSAFVKALGDLIAFVYAKGWELTLSEGYVGDTDAKDGDHDGPHRAGGAHYTRTGIDLNLFIDGKLIADGDHPAWLEIGAFWKRQHPLARWGGDFPGDANHFSFEHEGRK
jgi:hypothetical protein